METERDQRRPLWDSCAENWVKNGVGLAEIWGKDNLGTKYKCPVQMPRQEQVRLFARFAVNYRNGNLAMKAEVGEVARVLWQWALKAWWEVWVLF